MSKRTHDPIMAAAEKAYDATIAAGGTPAAAEKAAQKAANDASWPSILAEAVRSGILEIVGVREDGELVYRATGEEHKGPVEQ